tara:strand:- start:90 stop:704 length:615 start_codon:yes stop_codon:yes gene_type:complete
MTNKQQKIQTLLLLIGFILVIGTYFYYPNIKKNKMFEDKSGIAELEKPEEDVSEENLNTRFKNVEYQGYNLDNPFVLKSEEAFVLNENEPHILYMVNMHLILYLKNEKQIDIRSDKGRYNRESNDAYFENNVKAVESPGNTLISAENLNLLSTSSLAQIYNDVNLTYEDGSFLKADSIEYDFERKKLKVSMFNEERIKMKVISN